MCGSEHPDIVDIIYGPSPEMIVCWDNVHQAECSDRSIFDDFVSAYDVDSSRIGLLSEGYTRPSDIGWALDHADLMHSLRYGNLVVAHPYAQISPFCRPISSDQMADLHRWASGAGLFVDIFSQSWYCPGRTLLIVIGSKGACNG